MKTKHPPLLPVRLLMICLASLPLLTAAAETADSPPSIFSGSTEADQLIAAKKWDEAETKMLALIREPGVEPDHPALAGLRMKLAWLYRSRNRHDEAFTTAVAAVPALEKTMGRENPFSMSARWMAAGEAMAANKPAEAAETAAPLLDTMRDYVDSGRAATAQWQNVPALQVYLRQLPRLDESGIAEVAALLGRAWAAAGNIDKAGPTLREAVALLEKLHGAGHPQLVSAQQALETISAKRGENAGRRYVGDLGSARKIRFEGNLTFPAEELLRALSCDMGFVMASHPSAEFPDFPEAIRSALHHGYLNSGFPKAVIDVAFDPARDGGCMVARITEGPRYRMGEIRIEGARQALADPLRQKLLVVEKGNDQRSLAGLIRRTMKESAKFLPKPEVKAAETIAGELDSQLRSARLDIPAANTTVDLQATSNTTDFFQKTFTSTTADWVPGDPVALKETPLNPQIEIIRQRLAELGRPLARASSAHDFRDNGTVDLVIKIEDEGPEAVIGKIKVVGASRHTEEEIAKAAGLIPGKTFEPLALDQATVSLWNTGRFFPFAISSQPRRAQSAEVDLTIQVCEIAKVPRLGETVAPELETVRKFINTLNEQLESGRFTDFEWAAKNDSGEKMMSLGVSAKDGVFVEIGLPDSPFRQVVSVAKDAIHFELKTAERHGVVNLPGLVQGTLGFLNILPCPEKDGMLAFGIGTAFSSLATSDSLPIDLVITPAFPLLKPEHFKRDGNQVVVQRPNGSEILRLDMTTAMPVVGKDTTLVLRDGVVRERQKALAESIAANPAAASFAGWIHGGIEALKLYGELDEEDDAMFLKCSEFIALMLKPGVFKPFKDWFATWSEKGKTKDTFTIPMDPAFLQGGGGTMSLFVSLGAIQWVDQLMPADSWASKLSRELVFIYGGKTQYTKRTMDELLADPTVGPLGCLLAARLVSNLDSATAQRFLAKALEQANPEGFRHDWSPWLDAPTGLGKAVDDFLSTIARIDPQDEKTAADLLKPEWAEWLHRMFAQLRSQPAGQKTSEWIAPQMDALWTQVINESFRKQIESQLAPPHDPAEIAAVVNGQPVRRILVRALKDQLFDLSTIPLPPADATQPWTMDPELAAAIRFALLEQKSALSGIAITKEQTDEGIRKAFPHLTDQPDESWIDSTGMTRDELAHIVSKDLLLRAIVSSLNKSLNAPSEADVEAFYQQQGRALSRKAHVHMLGADRGASLSLIRSHHAANLLSQTRAALEQGLPFIAMSAAAKADSRSGLQLVCETRPLLDMNLFLIPLLEPLQPGETTRHLRAGSATANVRLEGWKDADPRPLAEVRKEIAGLLQQQALRDKLDDFFRQHEASVNIVLLDDPQPAAGPEPSAFVELLKANSYGAVGKLGVFWEKAVAKDKDAGNALDAVIGEGFLEVMELVMLADALLAYDQKPLAAMCLKEAFERDPADTRKKIAEAVSRHKTDGTKGQQDQIDQILKPAK